MPLVAKPQANNNTNYLNQLLTKFIPYWPLFLVILLACFVYAWYSIQRTPEKFLSSTSILIKEKKKGADEAKVIESLNPILTPEKVVENEIEIFMSKSLMAEVVKNLHLYAAFDKKNKFKWESAFTNSPISVVAKSPDSITYSKSYDIKFKSGGKEIVFEGETYPLDTWVKSEIGDFKFVPNKFYDGSDIEDLRLTFNSPSRLATGLSNALTVEALNKATAILSLEITNEVPVRGESILNELVKMYNLEAMLDKNKNAKQTLEFVEERLVQQKHELDSIEAQVQNYKNKNGGVIISEEGRVYLANVSEADRKLQELNLQLSVLDQVEGYVKSKENTSGIVPSTLGLNNELLSTLLTRLYDTELQKEELKKTVGENHPNVASFDDQIQKIRPSILENVENQRRALESNRSSVQRTSGIYSGMLNSIPQKERQLVAISRDHTIKSDIYSFLLQKREEAALTFATQVPESRVVDKAFTIPTPLEPQPTKTYINALAIGLLISIGLVSAKEMLNRKILFRHEIEAATALPIISEIAHDKSKDQLIPQDGRNTILASQFRKLRTSLSFLGIDANHKKLMVTSTISGEGKSFIAANLGLSLATTGKRVILVEFDMINPALSEKLNIHEQKGLSNFINGEIEIEQIIHNSKLNDNLFIIPSGPEPANPSEMILSPRVVDLINYLEAEFDYIIIDTAPVGPIPDAYILSSYCDATLYIIRHKYTPKRYIQRIDEENKIHPLKNAAIVFNGIRARGFIRNSYGMGYGYGHEYIYEKKIGKKGSYIVKA